VSGAEALARVPVAILAGGLGVRLRPALGERPKVLAEVAGRPFLAYLLDQVAEAGFRDVVLCTGWRADVVEHALGSAHGPLRLRYSPEKEPLGTAGALRHALPLLEGETVLVMNGDSFCDADLAGAWDWHRAVRSQATLLLVEVDDASRYGRVEVDAAGAICRFAEKQPGAGAGWINAGIYWLARARIESIASETPLSLERDVFPGWIGRGLAGLRTTARFLDIGTPRSYADASAFFRAVGPGSPA
jgi:D-glycero-alpha-D-manno-heptose 1-phosphate guanylyltransferase